MNGPVLAFAKLLLVQAQSQLTVESLARHLQLFKRATLLFDVVTEAPFSYFPLESVFQEAQRLRVT